MRYAVVIEKAGTNYGAYMPDLPGCIATDAIVEEVATEIRAAMELHIEGMLEDGLPISPAVASAEYVNLKADESTAAAQ